MCTDTGCACYSLKIVFPVLLPVKIPFTLQRTFYQEISGMEEKKGARKRLPSCLCSLFLFPFTACLVVLVNPALPICAERGALSDRRDCFTLHFKVELRPSAVRMVIDSPVSSDPKVPRCCLLYTSTVTVSKSSHSFSIWEDSS